MIEELWSKILGRGKYHDCCCFGRDQIKRTAVNDYLKLARECGAHIDGIPGGEPLAVMNEFELSAFAERVRQEERERADQDARRYRWLKMESNPGQPFDLHQKLREAKKLVAALEVFCTPWTGWDATIDTAILSQTAEQSLELSRKNA